MTKSVEEQWEELCKQYDAASDAYTEAMSNRTPRIYQNADFWKRLGEAEDKLQAVRGQMDEFRKKHSGT